MSSVAEVLAAVRQMSDVDREAVRRTLDEIEEREFQEERVRATREFHARGLTDDDIDEAVRRLRYESSS
jgi:Arc/MetJ-type ribon-helix-helix transcriptional regulator